MPGSLAKTLKDLSDRATIYLVRCGSQTPRNVAGAGHRAAVRHPAAR